METHCFGRHNLKSLLQGAHCPGKKVLETKRSSLFGRNVCDEEDMFLSSSLMLVLSQSVCLWQAFSATFFSTRGYPFTVLCPQILD
jgi:hypothetical protein